MKVDVQENSGTKRTLLIEVPAAEVDEKLKAELSDLQRDLKMPGFRKGKVPPEIVRRKFSGEVRREVAERIVRDACMDALRQHDLKPIAPPEIRDLQFEEGQPLSFRAVVEVWPEVTLGRYKGLRVKREVASIDEGEVERRLQMLREMQAELVPVEREASKGDFLTVDYDVFDDRDQPMEGRGVRNYVIELGSEGLVKEFTEGLTRTRVGDDRTLHVSFPAEGSHPDVAGKTLKFWVKVTAVREKRLPELNDEFAKALGKFDRLEDVKGEIRAGMEREAEFEADRRVREMLVDQVIRENPFETPESMVENLLEAIVKDAERQYRGREPFDPEKARAALRPVAVRHSRRFVVLREIARLESIPVTAADVDRRVEVLAMQTRQSPEEVRKKINADDSWDQLREDLLEEKVLGFLVKEAEVEGVPDPGSGSSDREASA